MAQNDEMMSFNLQGAKEVEEILKDLPLAVQAKILRAINKQAANIVKKELQNRAPADGDDTVFNAIKVKNDKEDDTGVLVGINAKKGGYVQRFQEYGTKKREKKSGADTGAISQPKPFVKSTMDDKVPEVIKFVSENYAELVEKQLKREVKKINKKNSK